MNQAIDQPPKSTTIWEDSKGQSWNARIRIAEAEKLNSEHGIDLLDPEQVNEVVSHPLRVVTLLCQVHREQYERKGMDAGDFAELCTENSTTATAAAEALIEGLADFFERLRKPALAEVVRKAAAASEAAEKGATTLIHERGTALIQRVVTKQMDDLANELNAVAE